MYVGFCSGYGTAFLGVSSLVSVLSGGVGISKNFFELPKPTKLCFTGDLGSSFVNLVVLRKATSVLLAMELLVEGVNVCLPASVPLVIGLVFECVIGLIV